jgi:hypothetical protein
VQGTVKASKRSCSGAPATVAYAAGRLSSGTSGDSIALAASSEGLLAGLSVGGAVG